jgi:hypothetical protein
MTPPRTADVAQANRLRWFLAGHLLAVLLVFEASLWVGQHLAARPEPVPVPAAVTADSPLSSPERLAAAPSTHQDSP